MNWATTAAAGINNGPSNGGKSLAEIQAEEEAEERKRQERERQQKRERQKEMGLAQVCIEVSWLVICKVNNFTNNGLS